MYFCFEEFSVFTEHSSLEEDFKTIFIYTFRYCLVLSKISLVPVNRRYPLTQF